MNGTVHDSALRSGVTHRPGDPSGRISRQGLSHGDRRHRWSL